MKIVRVEAHAVAIPETVSLAGLPVAPPAVRQFVLLTLHTDEGLDGIGLSFHFYADAMTPALLAAVRALAERTLGRDPLRHEALLSSLRQAALGAGPAGIVTLALAAIDIALWDLRGKALGQPLWVLLGGNRAQVPAYASGTLRRELDDAALVRSAQALLERGYRALKVQLALPGAFSPAREAARVRLLRDALPAGIALMADANQGWRLDEALQLAAWAADMGLAWIEDPVAADDIAAQRRVAAAWSTPVAGGEYLWGIEPFARALQADALDILLIDAFRAGGITPWIKIAALAGAFQRPVSSHVIPEILCHAVAAVPNGLTVECVPWTTPLFQAVPAVEDGMLRLPEAPGLGLALDHDFVARHRLD